MATALNLTMRLKQDPDSQKRLQGLKDHFADGVQQKIGAALKNSRIVHYARVLVIENQYIQVITEFDGDPFDYTEFFRKELPDVFKTIFSLVENAPSWEELNNPAKFLEFSRDKNLNALGKSETGGTERGYLFCAYGDATVREIQDKLGTADSG